MKLAQYSTYVDRIVDTVALAPGQITQPWVSGCLEVNVGTVEITITYLSLRHDETTWFIMD